MSKKIIGKFNIIDFLIIVLVILGITFAVYKLTSIKSSEPEYTSYEVKYIAREVPDYVVKHLEIGAPLMDFNSDNLLGTITDYEIKDAEIYTVNDRGESVVSPKEGYKTVIVTSEIEAEKGLNGFEVKKASYTLGYRFSVLCGKTKLYSTICSINEI